MRTVPEMLGSIDMYWTMNSILFMVISVYLFHKCKKTILNLFFCLGLWIMCIYDTINHVSRILKPSINEDYFKFILMILIGIISYIIIFRKRYDWRSLEGVDYNSNKIQAIYSRPSSLITLLGATTSLSPKCSVRYSYNGKTIRFKRGNKTPILCDTVIRKTDIIEDTDLDEDYFYKRWEEIKNIKYNLLTFNCKMLFKN